MHHTIDIYEIVENALSDYMQLNDSGFNLPPKRPSPSECMMSQLYYFRILRILLPKEWCERKISHDIRQLVAVDVKITE